MRQLARKFRSLSLVPSRADARPPAAPADSLRDHLEGWLNSVDPELLKPHSHEKKAAGINQRPLTSTDLIHVNRATVRESHEHRAWPPDVVMKFMAADVIRRQR